MNVRTNRRGIGRLVLLLTILLAAGVAHSQTVFRNPDFGYVVDVPLGWEVMDAETSAMVSFADPEHVAVFQILVFPGAQFATVQEIDTYIKNSFGADGDVVPFRFNGDHALFADYSFTAGTIPVRGYMTFVNRDRYDFAVMTFAAEEYYDALHDDILSALDSFAADTTEYRLPGPVAQFYAQPEQVRPAPAVQLALPSGRVTELPAEIASPEMLESTDVLIEREARILQRYAPGEGASPREGDGPPPPWAQAWRRYFRLIYRNSYERLAPVAEALFHDLAASNVVREQMPATILSWLQEAQYERTASLSDLLSPAQCLVRFAGDCDSLGLTYAILLHHLGFDAVLMVSIEYSHAMVGVDVPGEGARFPYQGREWLVAELTDNVAIGRIARDMADPAGWVGVKLDPTVP